MEFCLLCPHFVFNTNTKRWELIEFLRSVTLEMQRSGSQSVSRKTAYTVYFVQSLTTAGRPLKGTAVPHANI